MTATMTEPTATGTDWMKLMDTALWVARGETRTHSELDAADVAQEAVLAYFRTFGEGPGPENERAWLRRTIRNLVVDHVRRARHVDGAADVVEVLVDIMTESPSMVAVAHELLERVFAKLDGRELQVFRMRLHDVPAREVAERLDTTPAAVDAAFARAKRTLRTALEEDPGLLADLRGGLHRYATGR